MPFAFILEEVLAMMPGRELSSAWTFFYKFVFPTLWIGVFALIALLMFVVPDSFKGDGGGGQLRDMRWIFAGATVVGGGFIYWACMRLKKVSLNADVFVISNYRSRIDVPLRDVEGVSGSLFMSPELIWLRFRRPTPMGIQIVFMPKMRLSFGFWRHPLVAELQALVSHPASHA
jgi:hypothetical protein